MICLRLTVPIASWRKAHARELQETHPLPPPATCYGALLSLVGEVDRERHIGCRVTAGILGSPAMSTVLRSMWRVKDRKTPAGTGENARPDLQQIMTGAELLVWCDSGGEASPPTLETRVLEALAHPESVDRFCGWCLGESTHLINDVALLADCAPPAACRAFLLDPGGEMTLPVWVDHVGTIGTCYAVGTLTTLGGPPAAELLPRIEPPAR